MAEMSDSIDKPLEDNFDSLPASPSLKSLGIRDGVPTFSLGNAAGDTDVRALSTAVATILNDTRAYVGFPYLPTPNPVPPPKPAATLAYDYQGSLNVYLVGSWSIVTGLSLDDAWLSISFEGDSDDACIVPISLSPLAPIASPVLPDTDWYACSRTLQTSSDTQFTFTFTLANPLNELVGADFVTGIATALGPSSGVTYDTLTAVLDGSIKSSLTGEASLVTSATFRVHRTSAGVYFLDRVGFSFEAGIEWSPVVNITLTELSVLAQIQRTQADAAWTYDIHVSGSIGIDIGKAEPIGLIVSCHFTTALALTLTLYIGADAEQGLSSKAFIDALVPSTSTSSASALISKLPPSMKYYSYYLDGYGDGGAPTSASIVLQKGSAVGATWYISVVNVNIFLPGVVWTSPAFGNNDSLKIEVGNLRLNLAASRHDTELSSAMTVPGIHTAKSSPAALLSHDKSALGSSDNDIHALTTTVLTTTTSWTCDGSIHGTFALYNNQFPVLVEVEYHSSVTPPYLRLFAHPVHDYCPALNALASDVIFAASGGIPANLADVATTKPAPTQSPLSLSLVSDTTTGKKRSLWLTYHGDTLSRATLMSKFDGVWHITSTLNITRLGVMFDLTNPQSSDTSVKTISGYVYGRLQLVGLAELFIFVAGSSTYATTTPTTNPTTKFWAGLSINSEPGSRLGLVPNTVLQNAAFLDRVVPTDQWGLPEFPATVSDALLSVQAHLSAQFTRSSISPNPLFMSTLALGLAVSGQWNVYSSVILTTALTLQVYMRKTAATDPFLGWAEISGKCESVLQNTTYILAFKARLERNATSPIEYTLDFTVTPKTVTTTPNVVPPSTISTLSQFGGNSISVSDLDGKLPAGYPIQPSETTTTTAYSLSALYFSVNAQTSSWVILNSKITLIKASLELAIANPFSETGRQYSLKASGTVQIGASINLNAVVKLLAASDDPARVGWLKITLVVSASDAVSASTLISILMGTGESTTVVIPSGCPVTLTDTTASLILDIYCQPATGDTPWTLRKIDLTFNSIRTQPWSVGSGTQQLSITSVQLIAKFDPPSRPSAVFRGLTTIGTAVVGLEAVLDAANTLTIEGLVGSGVGPLFIKYVGGGLSNPSLEAPSLTSGTGLAGYATGVIGTAKITFNNVSGGYRPETLTVTVGTAPGYEWKLVDPTLVLTGINLKISLSNISDTPSLNAILHGSLSYQRPNGSPGTIVMDMTAKSSVLRCVLALDHCNFVDAVYVATAGRFSLPGTFWPTCNELSFSMNYSLGRGSFTTILDELVLTSFAPTIAKIQKPTMTLSVSLATIQLAAEGILEGDAVVFGITIPVSYELPDGPLRIWGIDIGEIYRMCKKLLEFISDLEKLCLIILDIVGLGEALFVGLSLVALGQGISAVWTAVKNVFGYDHDSDDDSDGVSDGVVTNKSNQNSSPDSTSGAWVIGGTGLSNGIASQSVEIRIYPKKINRQPLIINPSNLIVTIQKASVILSTIPSFNDIGRGGYSGFYSRPEQAGNYSIHIAYNTVGPPVVSYLADLTCSVTTTSSTLSANSILDVSANLLAGTVNYATIWPKDNFNNPRLGFNEQDAFDVTFTPMLSGTPTFTYYNDNIRVGFLLPASVGTSHQMTAKLAGTSANLTKSPGSFTTILMPDITKSIAGGPGLCSGKTGTIATFDVYIKDQIGQAFIGGVNCRASLLVVGGTSSAIVSSAGTTADHYIITYTRPTTSTSVSYSIKIFINDAPLPECPIFLTSGANVMVMSITQSILSLSAPPYYAGSSPSLQGKVFITAKDTAGGLWMDTTTASSFTVTLQRVGGSVQTLSLTDHGDGTSFVQMSFDSAGDFQIKATSAADNSVNISGSPISFTVLAAPAASTTKLYGPGLSLSSTLSTNTHFDVIALDQYGNVITSGLPGLDQISISMKHGTNITKALRGQGLRVSYTTPASSVTSDVIRLFVGAYEIMQSPFIVRATSPTLAANSVANWDSYVLNNVSSLTVIAVDAHNNRKWVGGDRVMASSSISGVQNWPFLLLNVTDNRDGSYVITYVPQPPPPSTTFTMNVTIAGAQIKGSPFTLPMVNFDYSASGLGTGAAGLTFEADFVIQAKKLGVLTNDSAVIKSGVIYPQISSSLDFVDVQFTVDATQVGQTNGKYTLQPPLPLGEYRLRLLANFLPISGSPLPITVTSTQPISTATVQGLDWFGVAKKAPAIAGSFSVLISPPESLQATQLVVTSAGRLSGGTPQFQISVDQTVIGKFNVNIVAQIGGTWPVYITFNGHTVQPTGSDHYNLVVNDASNQLTLYTPGTPAQEFSISGSTTGVHLSVQNGMLKMLKSAANSGRGQFANMGWSLPSIDIGQGFTLVYSMRWNTLTNTNLAEWLAPSITNPSPNFNLALRYNLNIVNWCLWDNGNWRTQTPSTITANGSWHNILFHVTPTNIYIYEDGKLVVSVVPTAINTSGAFDFSCTIWEREGVFDGDLKGFRTCPVAFHLQSDFPELRSQPYEIILNQFNQQANAAFFNIASATGAIPITYTSDSLRFYTPSLTVDNYTAITNLTSPLPATCAVQYRFRINASSPYETKIAIIAGLTFRILPDPNPKWVWYDGWEFVGLSSWTNLRVGGPYVVVMVIVSPGLLTLFEDGKKSFERVRSPPDPAVTNTASFWVSHHVLNNTVDVELSHMRVVSGGG
ncbi:hypothetical protein MMC11_000637 [Xylographa trunciseda]|nr:hypothetical protein [Xylographa trunciseda]